MAKNVANNSPAATAPTSGKQVLVVDDELLIRWSLRERLLDEGYRVVEAETGNEARASFEAGVDAIVLDIRLPDADGVQLMRDFLQTAPHCPVILISAHATDDVRADALRSGAYALLAKPFDVDDLVATLRSSLKQSA